ncbi:response regulator [Larkinella soli]|uniref:response regulator n=1 Tax=Larkinella soli TaxID=1770527 RepID=UPI000FFBAB4D|nr:response regulator [Larkinella soli]
MNDPALICLVEDDEDDVLLLQSSLHRRFPASAIRVFANGQDLMDCLEQTSLKPDMIFLDLNMPRMTGLEAMEVLRAHAKTQTVPIFVMTDSSLPDHILQSHQLGVTTYFVKPSSVPGLDRITHTVHTYWLSRHGGISAAFGREPSKTR